MTELIGTTKSIVTGELQITVIKEHGIATSIDTNQSLLINVVDRIILLNSKQIEELKEFFKNI